MLKPLRAASLSLVLAVSGASALPAFAQTAPVQKASSPKAPVQKAAAPKPVAPKAPAQASRPTLDEIALEQKVSDTVVDMAGWVIASGDNRGLPFAIVDKEAAQVLIFASDGKLKGMAPALLGSAVGDDSAPGVGDRELKDIPMKDRTTPAGRYLAGFGPAVGGQKVLWVDYATSISIHAIPTTVPKKEKRKERLASSRTDDNRITHGCINVSSTFYSKIVSPTFKKGGVFYVLPDSNPLQVAFPAFLPTENIASAAEDTDDRTYSYVARGRPRQTPIDR